MRSRHPKRPSGGAMTRFLQSRSHNASLHCASSRGSIGSNTSFAQAIRACAKDHSAYDTRWTVARMHVAALSCGHAGGSRPRMMGLQPERYPLILDDGHFHVGSKHSSIDLQKPQPLRRKANAQAPAPENERAHLGMDALATTSAAARVRRMCRRRGSRAADCLPAGPLAALRCRHQPQRSRCDSWSSHPT